MAAVTPEEFEAAIKALIPQLQQQPNGQTLLIDRDFDEITRLLQAFGKNEWSLRPRIYAVLRMISSITSIEAFIAEGLLDISIPFTEHTLPTSFSNHAARMRFLQLQHLVVNEAVLDVERQGSRHRHLNRDGDLYFQPLRELGRGGFAVVQLVRSKHSLQEYARKRMPRGRTFQRDKKAIANFERELEIYKHLSHLHLVQCMGSYTDPKYIAILLSPVADCNLEEFLEMIPFPSDKRGFLAQSYGCLTSALTYVHESCVRHKDIKPRNILIHRQNILLADFGTALDFRGQERSTTTGMPNEFTARYCSPEVAEYAPRNSSSDVYSLGCVFFEVTSVLHNKTICAMRRFFEENGNHRPFIRNNNEATHLWLDQLSGTRDIENEHIPAEWILEMLSYDPYARPKAADLLERIQDYSTKLCGDCCMDDLSDTSYAGSVADGVGEMSLDIEDTIKVQSQEDASAIEIPEESTEARIDDRPANMVVPTSSQEVKKVSTEHRALPLGSLNSRDQIEPETAFQHADAASKHAIADAQATQLLLDSGLDIHSGFNTDSSKVKDALLESKNNWGQTPLSYAAEKGHWAVVKLQLEKGAELESKNNWGQTPLSYAADKGHRAVVKLLLEKGAELQSKDNWGQTPLLYAVRKRHEAVVKLLIEKGLENPNSLTWL